VTLSSAAARPDAPPPAELVDVPAPPVRRGRWPAPAEAARVPVAASLEKQALGAE
jgi:hypothetical protein